MRKWLFLFSLMILFGCAQQVAPTGGPKDETPPKILSEKPANGTVDFSSDEIIISFDEFIQLKSPLEQVIISPPLTKAPSYQLKQKSLVIKFAQALASNTTYTINFGEAISDNNEGNILPNYVFVFSTGSFLDSMNVKGRLTDALTGEAEKGAIVMLYKNNIDSLPLKTLPDYFGRTGSDGSFKIEHVSDQPYKIFALKDDNSNYRFDVPSEKIGFLDSLIIPFSNVSTATPDSLAQNDTLQSIKKQGGNLIPNYDMSMFVEEDTTQFLKKSYCEHYGKLVFIYNRPLQKFDVEISGASMKKQWFLKDVSTGRDTVIVWTTELVPDTLLLLLDSGKEKKDTVEMNMKSPSDVIEVTSTAGGKGGKKKSFEKFSLSLKTSVPKGRAPKPDEALSLIWNHPIVGTELPRIKLYEDSVRVNFDISSSDPALRKFDIKYAWKKGGNYRLLVLDSAFTDLFGLWNDTAEIRFTGTDKNVFGDLSLKMKENPIDELVIELLNSTNGMVGKQRVGAKETISFIGLDPGKYTLRAIIDQNKNGKWDSGIYARKQQPEPVRIIQQGIEVRANWNMELEWDPNSTEKP